MSEILTRNVLEGYVLGACDSAGCCTNSGGDVDYGPCPSCVAILAHDAALRAELAKATAERDALYVRVLIEPKDIAAARSGVQHYGERRSECKDDVPCDLCMARAERNAATAELAKATAESDAEFCRADDAMVRANKAEALISKWEQLALKRGAERDAAVAEVAALKKRIEDAPHGYMCRATQTVRVDQDGSCDCWKMTK